MPHLRGLQSSLSLSKTAAKIISFRQLPRGWHYGNGVSATREAFSASLKLLTTADFGGFSDTDAVPGFNGEIQLFVYHKSSVLEFTVQANGSIDYRRDDNDQPVAERDDLTIEEALDILREFETEAWRLSGSSTASTIFDDSNDLAAWPSRIQTTVRGFRSSSWTASREPELHFADT
jgi:hypothetical protein